MKFGLPRRMIGAASIPLIIVICGLACGGMMFGETIGPVVAGQFYPSDPAELDSAVSGFVSAAEHADTRIAKHIIGLIAPHAGYRYSGPLAGRAYAQVKNRGYRTVIILAPSHHVRFAGVSLLSNGAYKTPLGAISINEAVAKRIREKCGFAAQLPEAFREEHSMEVQLPFLQKTLSNFSIVPIVFGELRGGEFRMLAEALVSELDASHGELLIVASTDLSHYHRSGDAAAMDVRTMELIAEGEVERLAEELTNGACEMCGAGPVITLALTAKLRGASAVTIGYAHSGETTGETASVVGYGALAYVETETTTMDLLTIEEQDFLLKLARRTLESHIRGGALPEIDSATGRLLEKRGVFVTLNKNGDLRGCIGFIRAVEPLAAAVREMTMNASTRDPRFQPVTADELDSIEIEISVLTPMKRVANVAEITVGVHGLYISRGWEGSGLLLPQVATDYGWNREEFLMQTCRKAGLSTDAWKREGTEIFSFAAQIFHEKK